MRRGVIFLAAALAAALLLAGCTSRNDEAAETEAAAAPTESAADTAEAAAEPETAETPEPTEDVDDTVVICGAEYDADTTTLDLSALTSEDTDEAAAALAKLTALESVELMDAEGASALTLSDVKTLEDAAPQAVFHYTFELFGQSISTDDKVIEFTGADIGNEGVEQIRQALDVLCCCTYFKLDECGIDNEVMAELRDDYPDTKIVWRVFFGEYMNCLTDEVTIRAIFKLTDANCEALKYCTEVKYMDIGHNTDLHNVDFVAYMPELEYVIVSGSPFTDLSPFANCPNLEFLEIVWCGVSDISTLSACTNLKYLNISYCAVSDISALAELPLERFCYLGNILSSEEIADFKAAHPDCWTTTTGTQPYGEGWRYDDAGYTYCDMYKFVRTVFDYDNNFYNKYNRGYGCVEPYDNL
ncbi:MAG: hypothetical protein LUD55_04990 [Oscillospiraceae bacterium]|nr:hypothetical protein [Oscillospiraceae bacterium]